jgi:hypothetical protein
VVQSRGGGGGAQQRWLWCNCAASHGRAAGQAWQVACAGTAFCTTVGFCCVLHVSVLCGVCAVWRRLRQCGAVMVAYGVAAHADPTIPLACADACTGRLLRQPCASFFVLGVQRPQLITIPYAAPCVVAGACLGCCVLC